MQYSEFHIFITIFSCIIFLPKKNVKQKCSNISLKTHCLIKIWPKLLKSDSHQSRPSSEIVSESAVCSGCEKIVETNPTCVIVEIGQSTQRKCKQDFIFGFFSKTVC